MSFSQDYLSPTRYATFDYEEGQYRRADLQRLDILAHGKPVDALTRLVARSEADSLGRSIIAKMKEIMERQQFDVILQARQKSVGPGLQLKLLYMILLLHLNALMLFDFATRRPQQMVES